MKVDKEYYKIERIIKSQKKGTADNHVNLYIKEGEKYIKIKDKVTQVNEWIKREIGESEIFLMTTMITQNNDNYFFGYEGKTQMSYLDRIFNLKIIKGILNIINIADIGIQYRI